MNEDMPPEAWDASVPEAPNIDPISIATEATVLLVNASSCLEEHLIHQQRHIRTLMLIVLAATASCLILLVGNLRVVTPPNVESNLVQAPSVLPVHGTEEYIRQILATEFDTSVGDEFWGSRSDPRAYVELGSKLAVKGSWTAAFVVSSLGQLVALSKEATEAELRDFVMLRSGGAYIDEMADLGELCTLASEKISNQRSSHSSNLKTLRKVSR